MTKFIYRTNIIVFFFEVSGRTVCSYVADGMGMLFDVGQFAPMEQAVWGCCLM